MSNQWGVIGVIGVIGLTLPTVASAGRTAVCSHSLPSSRSWTRARAAIGVDNAVLSHAWMGHAAQMRAHGGPNGDPDPNVGLARGGTPSFPSFRSDAGEENAFERAALVKAGADALRFGALWNFARSSSRSCAAAAG